MSDASKMARIEFPLSLGALSHRFMRCGLLLLAALIALAPGAYTIFFSGSGVVSPAHSWNPVDAQPSPRAAPSRAGTSQKAITIDYPGEGSIFPPEITPPKFLWRDSAESAAVWRIDVSFADGSAAIHTTSKGERMRVGKIDPDCISVTNKPPKLTPQQAAARTWSPEPAMWESIKKHSKAGAATVTIRGFSAGGDNAVSRGHVTIQTSKDPVGAPIFYRDVPLMPSETEKGIIKPLDQSRLPLINWRLRNVGESRSRLLLTGMYTCANCHSFSLDGKTHGDGSGRPAERQGHVHAVPIRRQMSIGNKDVIEWSTSEGKLTGTIRVGFMSQVSPDGQYVVTTMIQRCRRAPRERRASLSNYYVANFKDYRFLQVFYPTRGILAWYSRATGKLQPLPGADDQRYVHTNAVWSPDGKYLVFARAEARDAYPPGGKMAEARQRSERDCRSSTISTGFRSTEAKAGSRSAIAGRFAKRHEQLVSEGLAGRPLDRVRRVPQRPADAPGQPAVHRSGNGRGGAADAAATRR